MLLGGFTCKLYRFYCHPRHPCLHLVREDSLSHCCAGKVMGWLSRVVQVLGIVYVVKLSTSLLIQIHAGLSAYILPLVFNTQDFRTKYGEWALVTGCTQGIGREYALGLAARGMDLCLVGRNQKKLEEVQKEIEAVHNVRTKVIVADFTEVNVLQDVVMRVHDLGIDLGILGTGHSSLQLFCPHFKINFLSITIMNE